MVLQALSRQAPWADVEQVVVDLDRAAPVRDDLQAALDLLSARHAFLATLVQIGPLGRPYFVPAKDVTAHAQEPAPPHPQGWNAATLRDWLDQDRNQGFDLLHDPGWRVALFRRGENRCRLVVTIHHAKADLTTIAQITQELLTAAFAAPRTAETGQVPPLSHDGWSAARHRLWAAHDPDAAAAFFARHLAEDAPQLAHITDPAAPNVPPARPARLTATLSQPDTARLTGLLSGLSDAASPIGLGYRMIHGLQLAFGLAMARHCGTASAQFGLTFSGRGPKDGAAGSLIATLPQRFDLGACADVSSALASIAQATRDLRAFHCTSFEEIARSAAHNSNAALFDAALVYSPSALDPMLQPVLDQLGGGKATLLEEGRMPLTLAVYGQDALTITLEYDPTRLKPTKAEPLLAHVTRLLISLSRAESTTPLGDLAMLDAAEMAHLDLLSRPDFPAPDNLNDVPCPITRFEDQATRNPTATAIRLADGKSMNFARLDARVNGMAQDLVELGIGPGQIVALNLARGLDQVIAFLAVQKLGAAALPLDPATPELDRCLRVTESNAVAVIGLEGLPSLTLPLLVPRGTLALHRPKRPSPQADRMAYVLHTSGSTGRPKGVMGSTGALSAHATAVIEAYGLRPSDRVLQFASPGFDVALEEVIPTLLAGATLVQAPDQLAESIPAFLDCLARAEVTVANLPAGFWHLVVTEMVDRGLRLPPSLRLVITGSEKVDPRAWAEWARLAPEVGLMNCYGPTETTITVCHYRCSEMPLGPRDAIPVGRPLGHARLHVMAFDGSPAPLGAEGELWISGPCVTLGYLDRPAETAASFVTLSGQAAIGPATRAYRSGDRARWDGEGQLLFLGRRDRQVKLRGHRIDLDGIERQLQQFAGIHEVHVRLIGTGPAAGLVAWVAGPGLSATSASLQDLRRIAGDKFNQAALPRIVAVDALPRKPSGKIDHAALPLPDSLEPAVAETVLAEDDELGAEATLIAAIRRCMAEVLGTANLPPHADIRDHGANSLTILRMASVLEARFGGPIRTVDLYHNSTAARFARWLQSGHRQLSMGAMPIQPNGQAVVFVGVHLLGDREELYRPLSDALGPDFPVWGVTVGAPKTLDDVNIARIAELYRRDIEASFPTGPIALGAVSLASYFAYELAQLLLASGREVRLLAIFDAEGPAGRPSRKGWDKIRAHLKEVFRHGPSHLRRIHRLRQDRRQIDVVLHEAHAAGEVTGASIVQANIRAVDAYQPQPIACPLVVYRAASSYWDSQATLDDALGWRRVAAGGVDLVDVPGDHLGMLANGNVTVMARDLSARLKP